MAPMHRRALLLTGVLGLGGWPLLLHAQLSSLGRPLRLGLLPITSPRVLLGNYATVQAYLERVLGLPVELITAPDFRTFHARTLEGQYDLVVTAAYLGRLANLDAAWLPLVRYTAVHQTLLLSARQRPIATIDDLKGGVLSGPDFLTSAAIDAKDWLQARGLTAEADYTYLAMPPSSILHALVNGQSLMAVATPQVVNLTPQAVRDQVTVFAALPEMPSLLWLAHPRLANQLPLLKSSLLGLNQPEAGVGAFFEATGYQGVREVQAAEWSAVDRFVPRLREVLRASP